MPPPKDPVKLAEYRRHLPEYVKRSHAWMSDPVRVAAFKKKVGEITRRRMADPIERAKLLAWQKNPEKMRIKQEKMKKWLEDPRNAGKIAEMHRKQVMALERCQSDPILRARVYAWHNDPEKRRLHGQKTTAWRRNREKLRAALEKRSRNPSWLKALESNHKKLGIFSHQRRLERRKRTIEENTKRLLTWRNDPVKKDAWKLKQSIRMKNRLSDPVIRAEHIRRLAEVSKKRKGVPSGRKWTEEEKQRMREKQLPLWTPEKRQQMRELRLNNPVPIQRRNTSIERVLQTSLHALEIPFEVHKSLLKTCQPDLVVSNAKMAIFADGCFFHACPLHCKMPNHHIPMNTAKRDAKNNVILSANGWFPLRFWEHDIKNNLNSVIEQIVSCYSERHAISTAMES